jgi:hypothetical protein
MRHPLVWLPLLGAVLGVAGSFLWPWKQTELACPATTVTTSCVVPANLLWQHFEWGAVGAAFGVAVALLVIAIDGARGSRLRTHPGLPVGN